MFNITCPEFCSKEISYTLDTVFNHRLELQYSITYSNTNSVCIEKDNKKIILSINFFKLLYEDGQVSTAEIEFLQTWSKNSVDWPIRITEEEIPVLFGEPLIDQSPDKIDIKIDILGSIFFMLSRYEEINANNLDYFGRFPAKASLAYRCGFLLRPIVDEYIEILWSAINQLWPYQVRKEEKFRIIPTHDVDSPFLNIRLKNFVMVLRRMMGDLIIRKNPVLMCQTFLGWIKYKLFGKIRYSSDPFDVFDKLLSISKELNIRNKFYFMAIKEYNDVTGGRYDISHPEIKYLVKKISDQSHEIGLHPTGESYINPQKFHQQAQAFFELKNELGITGASGGRQHYLLWKPDETALYWQKFGFQYDSTLSYADHVGFRCGTCKDFYLWHHSKKQKMNLVEQPLIIMEGSLLSKNSMNLNHKDAKKIVKQIKNSCRKVNGNFVFLWHNSSFNSQDDWELYKFCLQDI